MKKLKFLGLALFASLFIISCKNNEPKQESFHLKGEFRGAAEGEVFLKVRDESGWVDLDTANLVDGKFEMNGHVDEMQMAYLVTSAFRGGIPIFLDNSEINISLHKDSIQDAKIEGNEVQLVFDQANAELQSLDQIWQDYYYNTYRFLTDDEKAQNESIVNNLYDSAQLLKEDFLKSYILKYNDNLASAQLLMDQEDALGSDAMLELYEGLSDQVKTSSFGNQLGERVDIIKKTAIGQPIINFEMNDTLGNPVQLTEVTKGKYVLIDFWAAWCNPCRKENPNVVANYNKYHADGFDVFGVSFDQKKENWIKAIKDDNLTWTHVSDLQGWANAAGKIYGIRSIPQNILIDPEGIILEKNLRGEKLGEKLEEIFGK